MAKATAICTCRKCGAKFEKYTTKASRREADSWVEWAERTFALCPDCEKAETIKHGNERAIEILNGEQLPALDGSDKQVAWAEFLRAKYIATADAQIKMYETRGGSRGAAIIGAVRTYAISNMTDASWWIDHRFDFLESVKEICREHQNTIKAMIK